ncbi:hypothetical protein DU508_17515 [Pedobacter chinensis]|uniref:Outer membrane protein beta-barrel domain-containing protein n=1 Tax=Pedobacter chinensis TaxID=2282421 RepID=A0A369PRV5_9SPHI|nr:outer membrane beta-barrel family protein [Pedobacter chinensis]RDC55371.1 hypothetical protein DU508_17515 [Pedobacter chinensis]
MKNKLPLSFILALFFSNIFGQETTLIIKDSKEDFGLPGVTLVLMCDSTSKKFISDQNGRIIFSNLKSGDYRLKTSYVGYIPIDTSLRLLAGNSVELLLTEETIALKGVNISAQKKFVEIKNGNFILNVQQNTLAKTSNAWDALKYGPLVETRMDGTLKVENKTATVFIDGRQVFMSGEELMNYLANIPAANIEKVEISSHPGAKFDSNIGSVILITTVNMRYQGVKGTLNLSNGYGVFPRYNAGLTLNGKKGKFVSQLGYNYSQSKTMGVTNITTSVNTKNLPWVVSQNNINESNSHRIYGSVGVDFNKNNLLTVYAEYAPGATNNLVMGNNGGLTSTRQLQQDSVWQSLNHIKRNSNTFASQAIYESKWDSTRQSLKFTLAYSRNQGDNRIDNNLSYFNSAGLLIKKMPFYRAFLPNQTDFATISGQYVRGLWGGEWISGVRYYNTKLSNENSGYTYFDMDRTAGETLTNMVSFRYNEFNYGAFTSWEAQVKSWYFQFGLRVEQNEVFSQTASGAKDRLYRKLSLFPTLFLQKKINAKNVIAFNYSKQISRPDYSLLNPFARFTDNTVANFVGNSQIRPARTHNLNFSWTYKSKLIFSAGLVILNDLISSILQKNGDGSLSQQYDNFNGVYYYVGAYYAMQPTKFWQVSFNGRLSTIDIQPYRNLPLGKANLNIYGNISNDLLLPKNFKIGIGLDFSNLSSDQFYHHRGYSNLSASLSKELKKPKLNIFLRGNDILKTSFTGNTALFLPYSSQSYNDKRITTLGVIYRFGKQTVKAKEIFKDDNLEESNKRL